MAFNALDLLLGPNECASLRNFVGLSTNKMLKLKQAVEGLSPIIKNLLFPPAMKDSLIELNKEGNLPSVVQKMLLVTKKEGNKMIPISVMH